MHNPPGVGAADLAVPAGFMSASAKALDLCHNGGNPVSFSGLVISFRFFLVRQPPPFLQRKGLSYPKKNRAASRQ